jgi:hypothetical protein
VLILGTAHPKGITLCIAPEEFYFFDFSPKNQKKRCGILKCKMPTGVSVWFFKKKAPPFAKDRLGLIMCPPDTPKRIRDLKSLNLGLRRL